MISHLILWLMLGMFCVEPRPTYVGGTIHRLLEVDLDRFSYYEMQDICSKVGAPISSRLRFDMTQIIDRHIQIYSHVDYVLI